MGSFAFIQGLQTEVDDTPIVDGQLFIKTDLYKMYNDQNNSRKLIGIYNWSKIISPFKTIGYGLHVNANKELVRNNIVWNDIENKPFKTVGDRLNISDNKLNATIQDWTEINKPFANIGNGLMVDDNNALKIKFEWMHILNKPFNTIGSGLNVSDDGKLNVDSTWSRISNKPFVSIGDGLTVTDNDILISDIQAVNFPTVNTPTATTTSYQELLVNNLIDTEVIGTKYLEQTKLLDTVNNNIFTYTSNEIKSNSVIDIFVDILNFNPLDITITNGSCTIIFPPYNVSTNLTCRLYIK